MSSIYARTLPLDLMQSFIVNTQESLSSYQDKISSFAPKEQDSFVLEGPLKGRIKKIGMYDSIHTDEILNLEFLRSELALLKDRFTSLTADYNGPLKPSLKSLRGKMMRLDSECQKHLSIYNAILKQWKLDNHLL